MSADDELIERIFGVGESELDASRRVAADGVFEAWLDANESLVDDGAEDIREWVKRGDRWDRPVWWRPVGRPWASSVWVSFAPGTAAVVGNGHTWASGGA
jgi:hypothetical protein